MISKILPLILIVLIVIGAFGGFFAGQMTSPVVEKTVTKRPAPYTIETTVHETEEITVTETATAIETKTVLGPETTVTKKAIVTETITAIETKTVTETKTATQTKTVPTTTTVTETVTRVQSSLRDPNWQELIEFLRMDSTEKLFYRPDEFDCSGFAITLRDQAWEYGFRCAYVEVVFSNGTGHSLNAFNTTDKGIIYVDVTGTEKGEGFDTIAYIQVDQPYGTISLDGVKFKYLNCSSYVATEFWMQPLIYIVHPDTSSYPTTYSYYLDYQKRVKFLYDSIDAYNEAVEEYNEGGGRYTSSQLTAWYGNLEALEKDLGPPSSPMGTVKNIEIYWN